MSWICYRKLHHWKYQLRQDYTIQTRLTPSLKAEVPSFILLTPTGELTIQARYAWDGPSGPTLDTKDFMRGSLVHDALYQLMREQALSLTYRQAADDLLKEICLQDGMPRLRAWYVHKAVSWFGEFAARPPTHTQPEWIYAPTPPAN